MLTANWKKAEKVEDPLEVPKNCFDETSLKKRREFWINRRIILLLAQINYLEDKQRKTTSWGAAVGAGNEWLKELRNEVRRLFEGLGPTEHHAGLPPHEPWPES